MMIFKSKNKLLTGFTLVLIAVYSLNNVFLSVVLSNVIEAAAAGSLMVFIRYAGIGLAGFFMFMIVGVIMVKCKTRLLKELNLSIKTLFINDIVYNSESMNDYSEDLSFMTNDLKQLETKGLEAEFTIASLTFTFVFALIAALFYDFWIAFAFFIGSLVPVGFSLLFRGKIGKASKNWTQANAVYTNRLKDYFNGIETVRTYQVEQLVTSKATAEAEKMEDYLREMNSTVEITNQFVYMGVMLFSLLVPFGIGIFRIIQYGVTLAAFIAIVQLSNSLRNPAIQIMQLFNGYATTRNIKGKYTAAKNRQEIKRKRHGEIPAFESLALKNLAMRFDQEELFSGVDLNVEKKDKILVTGPSGSGKSTLLGLIQQALPMTEGIYLYNGKTYPGRLSELFSFIRQRPLIFDDTILYNITLGECYPEEEVMDAVNLAQLQDVIAEKGLQYSVDENGKNLSAGQLQRIEIARALIRKRPIILADEITSALDAKTAEAVRKSLLHSPYTVIEVAHNVSDGEKALYTHVWNVPAFD